MRARSPKTRGQRSRLAYVIGNSKFYGHPLPSDELLAEVFSHTGFTLDRIDRMRGQSKAGRTKPSISA